MHAECVIIHAIFLFDIFIYPTERASHFFIQVHTSQLSEETPVFIPLTEQ